MIRAILQYQFLQNAFFAIILASVVCGVIGVVIVEKKLVMMSGGIAHTSFGGVGLGYLLGFEPIIGALLFSILAALGIGYIKRNGGVASDLIIGLFWSLGMALGVIFINIMPGYPPMISSYLFGNVLTVTRADLRLIALFTGVVIIAFSMLFNYWKAYLFDQEFTTILGVNTTFLEYFLFILIAISVVVLIRAVGIILVIALFTAPTATASLFTKGLRNRMILAVITSVIYCLVGLWLSYTINAPSGPLIVIVASIAYLILFMSKRMLNSRA